MLLHSPSTSIDGFFCKIFGTRLVDTQVSTIRLRKKATSLGKKTGIRIGRRCGRDCDECIAINTLHFCDLHFPVINGYFIISLDDTKGIDPDVTQT